MEFDRIREIISNILGIPAEQIHPDSQLGDDLCADSLQVSEIILAIEEEFQFEWKNINLNEMYTVEELYRKMCALKHQ